jgi:nucleotide-binding universal stress UspA family protein
MEKLSKILISLSLHEPPEQILSTLNLLNIDNNTQIYLLHVIEEMPHLSFYADAYALWEDFRDQAIQNSTSGMQKYNKIVSTKFKNITVIVEVGAASKTIVEKSNEIDCDLIIVGTHARKGIDHFIHSNVAEQLLRQTKRRVMSFHIEK